MENTIRLIRNHASLVTILAIVSLSLSASQAEEAPVVVPPAPVFTTETIVETVALEGNATASQPNTPNTDLQPAQPTPAVSDNGDQSASSVSNPASDTAAPAKTGDLEVDLIPLPTDVTGDALLLDLPQGNLPEGDILPTEVMTAIPSVPTEESVRTLTLRFKKLRVKIDKDPKLVELLEKDKKAKTFEQSRAARREYYRLLFTRMRKEDPSLKKHIDTMERAYLERLAQSRIEPTIPLGPPPAPEPIEEVVTEGAKVKKKR